MPDNQGRTPNRLIHEKSPYLLQHAYNPVDWYPWGDEAFEKARREGKPVFLSVGYSACHWCHVMEEESFEDPEVAEALNRSFVAVKVDREERPDVDAVYMAVCQALTGSGGWPMTIVMTPEQKPFFAGTYFPKRARGAGYGLMELLELIAQKWEQDRRELIDSGEKIAGGFSEERESRPGDLSKESLAQAESLFAREFDPRCGGFGGPPKFPAAHNLIFLLRYGVLEGRKRPVEMAEKTLEQMYRGGLFDHIGFGFSRYSTDEKWLVPHFEKMLYDNALLVLAYLEAGQVTGRELYFRIARKTLRYVLREMTGEQGGFYCAQDADSEGAEGRYYLFTPDEIIGVLGETDGAFFSLRFGVTRRGNFEGMNIPNLLDAPDIDGEDEKAGALLQKLYDYRLRRMRLRRDDKVLTSWNAMMAAAFSAAYRVLGDEAYLDAARGAMAFAEQYLTDGGGGLCVRYRDGETKGGGYLDDYAFTVWAYLSLYEATLKAEYLEKALGYCRGMTEKFADPDNGGFYLYGRDAERLIAWPKETYDGAMPSGNSVAGYVLAELARLTGGADLREQARRQLAFLSGVGYPAGHGFAMLALMQAVYPAREVVCVTESAADTEKFRKMTGARFLPNTALFLKNPENQEKLEELALFVRDYVCRDGLTTFYVCRDSVCSAPITDWQELEKTLFGGDDHGKSRDEAAGPRAAARDRKQ